MSRTSSRVVGSTLLMAAMVVVSVVGQDGLRGGRKIESSQNGSREAPELAIVGALLTSDGLYNRTGATCGSLASSPNGGSVRFDATTFTAPSGGSVTISMEDADGGSAFSGGGVGGINGPDTYLALYGPGAFSSASPLTNCLAVNDNLSGSISRSKITTTLPGAGTYTIVITSAKDSPINSAVFPDDGVLPWSYTISIKGPGSPVMAAPTNFLLSDANRGLLAYDQNLNFIGVMDSQVHRLWPRLL